MTRHNRRWMRWVVEATTGPCPRLPYGRGQRRLREL
jgi:hypothetical protein